MKNHIPFLAFSVLVSFALSSCQTDKKEEAILPKAEVTIKTADDLIWEQLNPARGDASPQSATLWGNRKGEVPTGFLVKFVDGFSSPPHIHNVDYRAVVIKGTIHNDHPDAPNMWMAPGSFWTQQKGQVHITSASGKENIAFVEIDQGPYLVKPIEEAFEYGSKPINNDTSNVVWIDAEHLEWVENSTAVQVSYLWQDPNSDLESLFIKLPAGFKGTLNNEGDTFRAVVINGSVHYIGTEPTSLEVGGSFTTEGASNHQIMNVTDEPSVLYISTNGDLKLL